MVDIVTANGRPQIDYTGRDYRGILDALYALVPTKLPEWRDFKNEADFGHVMLQLFAHVGDVLSYYQDRMANEAFLSTATNRRSIIDHLRLIGYTLGTAAPASTALDITVSQLGEKSGKVSIRKGAAFATRSLDGRPSTRFEYTGPDKVIDFRTICPDSEGIRHASITVEEGRFVADEVLGLGDGSQSQRYPLSRRGLILRPYVANSPSGPDIEVSAHLPRGADPENWSYRDTLAFSRANDSHFTIEIDDNDRAVVVFGDGSNGKAPDGFNGKATKEVTLKASYRTGGGSIGNVPAHAITVIVDAPDLSLLGAKVTNPTPATCGADRESVEHAVRYAPGIFRSGLRAVTAADYEALALMYPGVGKVRATAGRYNEVKLFVAPSGGGRQVTDTLDRGLKAYFEDKRMLTQVIEVEDVEFIPIVVTAEVGFDTHFVEEDVRAAIERAASALLAFDDVDFGHTVYLSRFYDKIQDVPGVIFLNITHFYRAPRPDDKTARPPADLIAPTGMIVLGPHEIPTVPDDDDHRAGIMIVPPKQTGR